MGLAYYNEIDPYAAQWLRNLIDAGHIAPGVVDERRIEDIHPGDLAGFTQCHFFAGIGVWSHALRSAGWADDRPVWTGSCPCQPFSAAGKGAGFADERHLWPAWHHLIRERKPPVVFGEQVASKAGLAWLDLVHADLEAAGYAVGAFDLCAAGVGAPHIRPRLYFMGHTDDGRSRRHTGAVSRAQAQALRRMWGVADGAEPAGAARGAVAHSSSTGLEGRDDDTAGRGEQRRGGLLNGERPPLGHDADGCGSHGVVAHADGGHAGTEREQRGGQHGQQQAHGGLGFWSVADWIPCRDGKWRPVEPGTFPLAHGAPARVGRLRAYGNAIVAPLAEQFIRAAMKETP